jgi:hypothetical protein
VLRTTRIVHVALTLGCAMLIGVALMARRELAPGHTMAGEPAGLERAALLAAVAGLVLAVVVANLLPALVARRRLAALRTLPSPEAARGQAAALWTTSNVLRWACIEAGTLLNAVLALVAGERLSFQAALAGVVLLLLRAPRRSELDAFLAWARPDGASPPGADAADRR